MPFLMGVLGWLYPEGYPRSRIVLVIIKYIGSYVNCKKVEAARYKGFSIIMLIYIYKYIV